MTEETGDPSREADIGGERRLLLVEDVLPLAQATAALLSETLGRCVVDIVHTADEVKALPLNRYELVFLDINVPGATGLSLAHWIANQGYAERTCLLTQYATSEYIEASKVLGFRGYIGKWESLNEFRTSVKLVMQGVKRFPKDIAESSLNVVLTEWERSICELLKEGGDVDSIAERLGSSAVRIKRSIHDIKLKLNVTTRREMIDAAVAASAGSRDEKRR